MPDEKRPILLCLDLEAGSEELIRCGTGYARCMDRPLHLLYVLPRSSSETEDAACERLKGLAKRTLEDALTEAIVVRRGNTEDLIVDYVKEKKVAMVVLGHRHKAKRERVYVGSTVKTVISLAPGPVLVVPIDGEE